MLILLFLRFEYVKSSWYFFLFKIDGFYILVIKNVEVFIFLFIEICLLFNWYCFGVVWNVLLFYFLLMQFIGYRFVSQCVWCWMVYKFQGYLLNFGKFYFQVGFEQFFVLLNIQQYMSIIDSGKLKQVINVFVILVVSIYV